MPRTTFENDLRVTGLVSQNLPAAMAEGSGITGTGTTSAASVIRHGDLIETRIVVDLTGLNGGGTINDIIGGNGLANSYIAQITSAVNGTIVAGFMRCLEVPTGSNADVDLYSATEGTGAEDALVTALTETLHINGGTWTLGLTAYLATFPAANSYLYLVSGAATDATFTAGIFEIVLYGR